MNFTYTYAPFKDPQISEAGNLLRSGLLLHINNNRIPLTKATIFETETNDNKYAFYAIVYYRIFNLQTEFTYTQRLERREIQHL